VLQIETKIEILSSDTLDVDESHGDAEEWALDLPSYFQLVFPHPARLD
jgi:hypothetical protein